VQEPINGDATGANGFMVETLRARKKGKGKSKNEKKEWTWKELSDLVKFSGTPISQPLLRYSHAELIRMAVECFACIMRYMGDLALPTGQSDVDCVYAILLNCHRQPVLRDEVYCQLMKQTTSNKSARQDSCQRGWRLFSIVAAYFDCSPNLRPYLFHYLETSAYDKRRAYHATALVCLQNFRKTIRYLIKKLSKYRSCFQFKSSPHSHAVSVFAEPFPSV
jgi:myosin-15